MSRTFLLDILASKAFLCRLARFLRELRLSRTVRGLFTVAERNDRPLYNLQEYAQKCPALFWDCENMVKTMVCTKTINYRLSLFFNLSFICDKWETINDKSIFFIFWPFLSFFMIFQSPKISSITFHFEKWLKFGGKGEEKYCPEFFQWKMEFSIPFLMIL